MLTCAVLNQKGGVGKTTVTLALAEAAADAGSRVLLVDLDPQNNAGECLCAEPPAGALRTDDLVEADRPGWAADAARPSAWAGADVVPSTLALAHREREASLTILYRLCKALRGLDGYDLVLLDCPPSVGTLTVNALVAATSRWWSPNRRGPASKASWRPGKTLDVVAGEDVNPRLRLAWAGSTTERHDAAPPLFRPPPAARRAVRCSGTAGRSVRSAPRRLESSAVWSHLSERLSEGARQSCAGGGALSRRASR